MQAISGDTQPTINLRRQGEISKNGRRLIDIFIVFHSTRVAGPTVPIVQDNRDTGNGLVSWGSWHPGACHFALADGSVRAISKSKGFTALNRPRSTNTD